MLCMQKDQIPSFWKDLSRRCWDRPFVVETGIDLCPMHLNPSILSMSSKQNMPFTFLSLGLTTTVWYTVGWEWLVPGNPAKVLSERGWEARSPRTGSGSQAWHPVYSLWYLVLIEILCLEPNILVGTWSPARATSKHDSKKCFHPIPFNY